MEFCGYPLNGKLLKEQKRSAKIYAEKKFSNEPDDIFTFSRRILILSGVNEWVPRDPNCGSPYNEGNISGENSIDVRHMNDGNNGQLKATTDLQSALSQSM